MVTRLLTAVLLLLWSPWARPVEPPETDIELVQVRGVRQVLQSRSAAQTTVLRKEHTRFIAPTHPNELFQRSAGTWVSRGSGQEHLTAIRSPVLTGPGACGAFLLLEDGVPVRPAGFCNVNGLFELNLAQAARIDVARGPGAVIDGSNALHGVISSWSISPAPARSAELDMELGSHRHARTQAELTGGAFSLAARYTDAGSFRDDESFRHAFLNATWQSRVGGAEQRTSLALADLDQDTAGYVFGRDAYRDEVLRKTNVNPEAYRQAEAFRLVSRWSWQRSGHRFEWTPYARHSTMAFLQHFLPGKPLERNAQSSAGMRFAWLSQQRWSAGLDLERAEGDLTQFQEGPLTDGSPFLRATRPAGFHYDYAVTSTAAAAWAQFQYFFQDNLELTGGLRYEWLAYDYDNRMLDGNTRDDGSPCGFGGCLYTRPADRSDRFSRVSPELGLRWQFREESAFHARLASGFRFPQATELYRLQSGQQVSDLAPTTLDALEAGYQHRTARGSLELTLFAMRKRHFIFRDAEGYNVSDGRTRHRGVEFAGRWSLSEDVDLGIDLSYARHLYDFDRDAAAGEAIRKGNAIDTAPRWLGGLRLGWRPAPPLRAEAEWAWLGEHFLDAANQHRYGGHGLLHLRAEYALRGGAHRIGLRLSNALDERYAERADYAFGNYRYFPGAGRQWSLNWRWRPERTNTD